MKRIMMIQSDFKGTCMLQVFLLFTSFLLTRNSFAQNRKTIYYQQTASAKTGVNAAPEFKLIINDSASYFYCYANAFSKYEPKAPLVKKLRDHDIYIDLKKGLWLHKGIKIDTVFQFPWTITTEEKTILGYKCHKATGRDFSNNEIVVWYSNAIPLPHGPFWAVGLPGLVLEITESGSGVTYTAFRIEDKAPELVEPRNGRRTVWIRAGLTTKN